MGEELPGCLVVWWQEEVAGPGFTHPLLPFSAKEGEWLPNQPEFLVSPYCIWRFFLLFICC